MEISPHVRPAPASLFPAPGLGGEPLVRAIRPTAHSADLRPLSTGRRLRSGLFGLALGIVALGLAVVLGLLLSTAVFDYPSVGLA
jgi:hypothetical protein